MRVAYAARTAIMSRKSELRVRRIRNHHRRERTEGERQQRNERHELGGDSFGVDRVS
jgi:hypothetical protein